MIDGNCLRPQDMEKMVGACGLERIVYHSSIHRKHTVGGMISHRAVTKWLKRIDRSGELAWDGSTLFSMAAAWRVTRHHTEVARAEETLDSESREMGAWEQNRRRKKDPEHLGIGRYQRQSNPPWAQPPVSWHDIDTMQPHQEARGRYR